jgi:hypothetical protein
MFMISPTSARHAAIVTGQVLSISGPTLKG